MEKLVAGSAVRKGQPMPDDVVKFDYAEIVRMIEQLAKAAVRLEETQAFILKAVEALRQGGLQGQAGDHLADAMQTDLLRSTQKLQQQFSITQQSLMSALNDMAEADKKAASQF